jgi:hypothetical protein
MSRKPGEKLGPYEVTEELGAGAFKRVLRARNLSAPDVPPEVALAIPHRQDLESALRHSGEFELMRHLRHPNIVRVYETRFLENQGLYFVVMELVRGQGLNARLAAEGRLAPTTVARLGVEVASALAHAHSLHVVHRDIKPGNILLTEEGVAKVTDFGIARLVASTSGQADSLVGTIDYMAPEQFRGATGRQADVWALAVTLYEALTGVHPFRGENSAETMHRIETAEVVAPAQIVPDLPEGLATAVMRGLERDLTRRYATADELATALREFLRGETFESPVERLLFEYLRASYSLLYLVGHEEARMAAVIRRVTQRVSPDLGVWEWRVSQGLVDASGKPIGGRPLGPEQVLQYLLAEAPPAVYLLRDLHHFLSDPVTQRLVREAAQQLGPSGKTAIVSAPVLSLPPELEKDFAALPFGLPGEADLDACLQRLVTGAPEGVSINLSPDERSLLVRSALGLTEIEAENAFVRAVVADGRLDANSHRRVLRDKQQLVARSGVLEFVWPEGGLEQVGGLTALKDWFGQRSRAFSLRAREFGLPAPKGVMLVGVPGCGKSLSAKAVAYAWGKPLLRLDVGRVLESAVGSSEANLRMALSTAEAVAPCVLWIDEIEKAFAGSQSHQGPGVQARLLGYFLNWLQEKVAPVFVVATANLINALPPELLRKGRWDEIFFVDLPEAEQRRDILDVHVRRLGRDPAAVDLAAVADATDGFSGAEIERLCVDALYRAFFADTDLATDLLLAGARDMRPLSRLRSEEIEGLRAWGHLNAKSAA